MKTKDSSCEKPEAHRGECDEIRLKHHLPWTVVYPLPPSADSQSFLLVPDHWGWLGTVEKGKPQEQAHD